MYTVYRRRRGVSKQRFIFVLFSFSLVLLSAAFLFFGYGALYGQKDSGIFFERDFTVQDLVGTPLVLPDAEIAQSVPESGDTDAFQVSEVFAGQGGYDLNASPVSRRTSLSFLPAPAVWMQAIQNADLYPELAYSAYRIREGDMIGVIAEQFGLSQDTLISVNNIRQTRRIQIGEYLRIPSISGILYTTKSEGETPETVAEKFQVSAKKTAAVNHLVERTPLAAGTTLFVPDAFLDWITRQEINGDLFKRPIHGRYYFSSPYGWRNSPFTGKRSFHNGVDMASPMWTPIYAALSGKVTVAGSSAVYGNYVIVSHHSGYRTLYGHMADIKVRTGQYVDTKTVLGWVGNTGMSTGPHLHFTIFKHGSTINPVSLWN